MNAKDIDIRVWPPGSVSTSRAVLALHVPTGAAVVVNSESSRERNQKLAVERVQLLLHNLPWST
jgi:protein subunit release factor A